MYYLISLLVAISLSGPGTEPVPQETLETVSRLTPEITAQDMKTDVFFLAADECAGRMTGSPGVRRASQYITAAFKQAGLKPLDQQEDYYQSFDFAAGLKLDRDHTHLKLLPSSGTALTETCKLDTDFRPLVYSASGEAEGEILFVGYGLVEPSTAGKGYNSYSNLDVRGKIVLALSDLPENVPAQRRQELSLYAGSRYKAKLAADYGAKAFLMVTGPNSHTPGQLVTLRPTDRTSPVVIPAASISGKLADQLLAPASVTLKDLQDMLDDGKLNPHANVMPGTRANLNVSLDRIRKPCRNVIAMLPPTSGVDEYVMIGAHYDHIGTGIGMGSLAKKGEEGQIHNGADDNASGATVIMELAAALADARRQSQSNASQRGIIFACWSGEELGLVGSSHYSSKPLLPLNKVAAYFNFDMVGRLKNNRLILQSVGSSSVWRKLIERRNIPAGFDLSLQDDPYLPTDATAFYTKGIPTLSFFTDLHDDYNRPTDDPETLNYQGMQRVAKFARLLVQDALNPDLSIDYAKVTRRAPAPSRGGRRAYTGTIPDFVATDTKGVRLADVRGGGPAEKAGLKTGDIIVEFAGKEINNLQDYSDALIGAKVGEPVSVIVMRDGKRMELTITPTGRPQ